MTLSTAGALVSSFCGRGSVALLIGLVGAAGCGESGLGPDVPENNVVLAGDGDWGDDPYVAHSASVDGHGLTVEVSYAGGCRRHVFTLVIAESFMESDPVQLSAELVHEANGDACEAWLTNVRVFDLELVRTRYRQFYGPGPGTVVLRVEGLPGEDLVYEFAG